jgi:hypothetical protein
MTGPLNVQAVFSLAEYPLLASAPGGGDVLVNGLPAQPVSYHAIGSQVTLTASASNGWTFLAWTGSQNSTNIPFIFTVTESNDVQAVFGTSISTNVSGAGSIALSPPGLVPFGAIATATAIAAPGYYIKAWSGAAKGTNLTSSFLITNANPSVGALFVQLPVGKCSLNVAVNGEGTVGIDPMKVFYEQGDVVTITATPTNSGAVFGGWSGDASGTQNPFPLLMNTNKILAANFGYPPTVSISPESQIVVAGSNATITATGIGLPPLSYQWLKETNYISATNAAFEIVNAAGDDAGQYSVIVSNPYGSATSAVSAIEIVWPPSITLSPISKAVATETSLTLGVAASGTQPLSYQWMSNAGPMADRTNADFTLSPVQMSDANSYYVIVTNAYGAATSAVATIVVYVPARILTQPQHAITTGGGTVSFSLVATGDPAPAYQWKFNGLNLPGATATSLIITNVRLQDCGLYSVVADNGFSSETSVDAALSMLPTITSPFAGLATVWGRSIVLGVSAIGSGDLAYQWFKDGVPIESAISNRLSFSAAQVEDSGFYSVVVTSLLGSITNSAQVVINAANVDLGLYAGVTITGTPGYTYQIQYSTDLRDTNSWQVLTNVVLQVPTELWVDTNVNAAATSKRFYRVLPGSAP